MEDFRSLILEMRQHGFRVTWQRIAVLQALCELDGHASAEMIHQQVHKRQQGVDLSTVYRTLERLRDLRVLSQTDLGRGCAEYEIVTGEPHHHLVCNQCGRVTDLRHTYLATLDETIRRDFGFRPILDHMAIFGLCGSCIEPAEPGFGSNAEPPESECR